MAKAKLAKFAKRHYEQVAAAMQSALLVGSAYAAVTSLSDMFAKDNPAFDRDRFERACVPGARVRARSNPLPLVNEWARQ
jgi:hypothetical protein